MRFNKKTKMHHLKNIRFVFSVLLLLFLVLSVALGNDAVSADPPGIVATQQYCKSKASKQLDSACTKNNMAKLRDVVESQCKTKSEACIAKAAEDVIDKIVKQKPKNSKEFENALDKAMANINNGGGSNGPKGKSVQTSGDQSDIKAGGLPTVDASSDNIKNILQIMFGIIGAFAVLNITFSGLKYVTSAGNEQKTAEAKNGIVYSLVGLAIAISAEAIVAFVVTGVST